MAKNYILKSGSNILHCFNYLSASAQCWLRLVMVCCADRVQQTRFSFPGLLFKGLSSRPTARRSRRSVRWVRATPSVIPHRYPEHRELFLSGLRLAAVETT